MERVEEKQLLTRDQVAKKLEVSTRTIRRWEQSGRLPCVKISDKIIRYRLNDLNKLMNEMYYLKRV
jgi:excisionase family DNA binding protein